jgi:anti-anti-sigma factor
MAANLIYSVKEVKDPEMTKIVTLEGDIDESNQDALEKMLQEFLEDANTKYLVLNISQLDYINSGVIGLLASYHAHYIEESKNFVYSEANDNIYGILDLVGMTAVIECFETDNEACLSFED